MIEAEKTFPPSRHQLGFIWLISFLSILAISFDLYAKYGNNRTLSLVSPKKPYYQWRLRVPSGHVVRLVVLTLQGATPGSCTAHKLSAYDFLLPLQNKIIARFGAFGEFRHVFSDCVVLNIVTVKYWTVSDGAGCRFQAHLQSWSWPPRGMWCWSPSPSAGRKMEQSSKLTFKPSQKQVGQVAQNETTLPDVSGLPYILFHSHL